MASTVYNGQIFETSTVANGQFGFSFEDSQGAFGFVSAPFGNPVYLTSCLLDGVMTSYSSFPVRGVSFSIEAHPTSSGVYNLTLSLSDGVYLTGISGLTNFTVNGGHFLSSLTAPIGGGSVDLTSVMSALSSLDSHLTNIDLSVSTVGEQVYQANSKIDALDLQVPDNLNTQLSELSILIGNIDLSTLNSLNFIEQSLNGNGSRYLDGEIVKVANTPGEYKIISSAFCRSDGNIYTVIYKLHRKVVGTETYVDIHFIPEALIYSPSEIPTTAV